MKGILKGILFNKVGANIVNYIIVSVKVIIDEVPKFQSISKVLFIKI